jgi:hypothetical protein
MPALRARTMRFNGRPAAASVSHSAWPMKPVAPVTAIVSLVAIALDAKGVIGES